MPPTRVQASTTTQDCLTSGFKVPMILGATDPTRKEFPAEPESTNRAASVPVSRRANPGLESLRSKNQKISSLHVEDIPPSSLPTIVIPRGRKRDSSSCVASLGDCIASASVSAADPIGDTGQERPRKRSKRSSSTPAASRSSQLSTQLRRRSRSRVDSSTDVEFVQPSRVSARLARKIHPFINSRSSDIYMHLANPDDARNLLNESSASSVTSSTPNEMVGLRSLKRYRGRRRKTVDLADENAKKDLMEEWARMRQSQGALPLSGIDENACSTQMLLRDTRECDGPISSTQLEAITRKNSRDPDLVKNETLATINILPQTILEVSSGGSFSTRKNFENALPADTDAIEKTLDFKGSVPPSDGRTEQPLVPSVDDEAPSTSIPAPHTDEASPGDELTSILETDHHLDLLQRPGSSPPALSSSPSRKDSAHNKYVKSTNLSMNVQAEAMNPHNLSVDSHSVASQTSSFNGNSFHLDSDEEFYMLDIPEVFTSPWVPVAPHLYVPPSLGKLISGMREQLAMEARARRRAEELCQAELIRRISAEKIIEDLRTELTEKQKDVSGSATY